jgi:hypothetical protein
MSNGATVAPTAEMRASGVLHETERTDFGYETLYTKIDQNLSGYSGAQTCLILLLGYHRRNSEEGSRAHVGNSNYFHIGELHGNGFKVSVVSNSNSKS